MECKKTMTTERLQVKNKGKMQKSQTVLISINPFPAKWLDHTLSESAVHGINGRCYLASLLLLKNTLFPSS
jgi:hypothetical protein